MKGRKPKLVALVGGRTGRLPPPPKGLNEHGAAEWKRVAPTLHARGRMGPELLATVEAYCRAVGLARAYTALMDDEGHVVETERGRASHPAFKMLMGAMREARLLAAELGLTRAAVETKGHESGREGWGDDADVLA